MEFTKKQVAIVTLALFVGGAAIGRFSLPARVEVKTETKIVEKEVIKWKTDTKKSENKDKDTVTIETHYPDGRIVKEKHTIDKGTIVVDKTSEGSKEKDKESDTKTSTVTEYATHEWNISALGAAKKSSSGNPTLSEGFDYGAHVQRRILGPFYLGGFGLTDKTFGASAGVSW